MALVGKALMYAMLAGGGLIALAYADRRWGVFQSVSTGANWVRDTGSGVGNWVMGWADWINTFSNSWAGLFGSGGNNDNGNNDDNTTGGGGHVGGNGSETDCPCDHNAPGIGGCTWDMYWGSTPCE